MNQDPVFANPDPPPITHALASARKAGLGHKILEKELGELEG